MRNTLKNINRVNKPSEFRRALRTSIVVIKRDKHN